MKFQICCSSRYVTGGDVSRFTHHSYSMKGIIKAIMVSKIIVAM